MPAEKDLSLTKERLAFAQEALRHIIRGGKVCIQYDARTWLVHQLERMHDQNYLASPPHHYYYFPEEPAPEAVTTIHPMPHHLRANRLRMIRGLGDDAADVHILGSQIKNKSGNYVYEIPEHVRAFVAPRADIYAADEMVTILRAKVEAFEKGDFENPILKKPLVISNQRSDKSEGYWSAFISAFGIDDDPAFFAEKVGVHVARTRHEAVDIAKEKLPRTLTVPPKPANGNHFKTGTTLFIHTTTLDKIIDHIEGFSGAGAVIRPLHLTGAIAESPEETAQTAEGNALGKSEAAQIALAKVPDDLLLKRFGITRAQAGTLVDDTYSYFKDKRLLQYFDLTGLEHKIDRAKWLKDEVPFPGVEIGPVINACNGPANFCKRANEAFRKLQEATNLQRAELRKNEVPEHIIDERVPPVDRTMVEGSAIIYQPAPPYDPTMNAEKLKALGTPLYVVTGIQHFNFMEHPIPRDVDPRLTETYHYQIPVGIERSAIKSRAQLMEEGNRLYEPRRKADMALYYELGGDLQKFVSNTHDLRSEPFNVLISSPEGSVENQSAWLDLVNKFSDSGIYTRIPNQQIKHLVDVEDKIVRDADGILLMPDPAKSDDPIAIAEKKFKFWSIVVAKQTDPRDMNMPIVLFDPKGTWKEELEEYTQLYFLGALKEKPELIFKVAKTKAEVLKHFEHARDTRYPPVRLDLPSDKERAIPKSGKFNVAIFCSASFENEQMLATAYNLGYNFAMSDFGLVYGGGSRYMMGEINEGVQAAREAGKDDAWIAGSNINHLVLREGKPPEGLNDYYNAPNIYKRMDYMFGTCDCAVVAPGGPGTMQELAGLALYLSQNHELMQNKEVVIVNQPVHLPNGDGTHTTINYFDLMARFLPAETREKLHIHVVDSPEAAKEKVEEIRERSEKAPTLKYTRREGFNDAWAAKESLRRNQAEPPQISA